MAKKTNVELESLKTQLARALADYDNLQRRVERQSVEMYSNASVRIVKRLLAILDMLDFAQNHLNDAGLAITLKEFRDLLKEEGYDEIRANEGEVFDPEIHEAIEVVETADQDRDNTIASVSVNGWRQANGAVLRHAKVKVAKAILNEVEGARKENKNE